MTWCQILRDFLRGYTDADLDSLDAKLLEAECAPAPGGRATLTARELAAMGECLRRRGQLPKMCVVESQKESQCQRFGTTGAGH